MQMYPVGGESRQLRVPVWSMHARWRNQEKLDLSPSLRAPDNPRGISPWSDSRALGEEGVGRGKALQIDFRNRPP